MATIDKYNYAVEEDDEQELDLGSLFAHLLRHWKRILAWTLIVALAVAAYCAVRNAGRARSAVDSNAVLSGSLSADRVREIGTLADRYLAFQDVLANSEAYIANSYLMQLDPNQVCTVSLEYLVTSGQAGTVDSFAAQALGEEEYTELAKVLTGNETSSSFVGENRTSDIDRTVNVETMDGMTGQETAENSTFAEHADDNGADGSGRLKGSAAYIKEAVQITRAGASKGSTVASSGRKTTGNSTGYVPGLTVSLEEAEESPAGSVLSPDEKGSSVQNGGTVKQVYQNLMQVTIWAETKERGEKAAAIVEKAIASHADDLKAADPQLGLQKTSEQISEGASAALASQQDTMLQKTNTLAEEYTAFCTNNIETLEDEEESFFRYLVSNKDYQNGVTGNSVSDRDLSQNDETGGGIGDNMAQNAAGHGSAAAEAYQAFLRSSQSGVSGLLGAHGKRNVGIGALVGFAAALVVLIVGYLCSSRYRTVEEIEEDLLRQGRGNNGFYTSKTACCGQSGNVAGSSFLTPAVLGTFLPEGFSGSQYHGGPLNKAILRRADRIAYRDTAEIGMDVVAVSQLTGHRIRTLCSRFGVKKLYLLQNTSSKLGKEALEALLQELRKDNGAHDTTGDAANGTFGDLRIQVATGNPVRNPADYEALAVCDAAVLFEGIDDQRRAEAVQLMQLCGEMNVSLLGAVVVGANTGKEK